MKNFIEVILEHKKAPNVTRRFFMWWAIRDSNP